MTSNFLTFSNTLIVVTNARAAASPVRCARMNQYPGVNRHISAGLSGDVYWALFHLRLTESLSQSVRRLAEETATTVA